MNIDSAGVGAFGRTESLHEPTRNSNVSGGSCIVAYLDAMMVMRDSGHVQNH